MAACIWNQSYRGRRELRGEQVWILPYPSLDGSRSSKGLNKIQQLFRYIILPFQTMNTFYSPPTAKSPSVKFSYSSPTHQKTAVFSPSASEVTLFRTLVSLRTASNAINSPRLGERQDEGKKNGLLSSQRWKREQKQNLNSEGRKSASQSVILYKNPEENSKNTAETSFCLSDLASRLRNQQISTVKSLISSNKYTSQQNTQKYYGQYGYSRVLEEKVGQNNIEKKVFNFSKVKPKQRRVQSKFSNAKIEDFVIGQMIGKGGVGRVFLSKHLKTGFYYALKVIKKAEVKDVDQLAFGIKCHFFLTHTNIAQLYACFCDQQCIYLVMEICIDGNLSKYRKRIKGDEERQYLMEGISRGIQYMHGLSLRHGDLKLQNILVSHGFPKITDFDCVFNGRHKQFRQTRRKSKLWGSPAYFSPDMMREHAFTLSDDLWALGIIMYEVYCNEHPFSLKDANDLTNIVNQDAISLPNSLKQSKKTLISSLLVKNREKRVTIEDVMRQLP